MKTDELLLRGTVRRSSAKRRWVWHVHRIGCLPAKTNTSDVKWKLYMSVRDKLSSKKPNLSDDRLLRGGEKWIRAGISFIIYMWIVPYICVYRFVQMYILFEPCVTSYIENHSNGIYSLDVRLHLLCIRQINGNVFVTQSLTHWL